jgi:hypothetical protein
MQENNISLKPQWPQPTWAGFDFVIFDCDSTLSTIEGIDELARKRGKAVCHPPTLTRYGDGS